MTDRQREVHETMIRYQLAHGLPPTLRELRELLDIDSTNGVRDHLLALEKRGLVRHHAKGSARGWVALQPQEGTAP